MTPARPTIGPFERLYAAYARMPKHRGQARLLSIARRFLREHRLLAQAQCALMRLDVNDGVQIQILVQGAYEPLTLAALSRMLMPGQCFVDVGAHVGQFSLMASRLVGDRGRVIAIEPNPQTFSDLQENLALNAVANVTPMLCAVANAARLLRFAIPPPGNRGASREAESASEPQYVVGAFSLAYILAAQNIVCADVVKIDVEGAEWHALEGLLTEPARRPAHIVFEFLPRYFSYDVGPRELLAFVQRNGYALHTVEGAPFEFGDPLPENNIWAQLR